MKRTSGYLLLIAALVAILHLPANAAAESDRVPAVNQKFTTIDCGTPIEVLRLYRRPHPRPVPITAAFEGGSSSAVDRGCVLPNVNDAHTGTAPDLGCHELESDPPHYGPRRLKTR